MPNSISGTQEKNTAYTHITTTRGKDGAEHQAAGSTGSSATSH